MLPFYIYSAQWSAFCLPIAVFSSIILWSSRCALGQVMFLVWMQFVVYLLHQSEEHFWPGGFKAFINKKIFHAITPNNPLSDKDVFWINIPVIWILFPLAAVIAQHVNSAVGSFLPVFGMFNATTHVLAGLVKRCYNPGLMVSLLLNLPTGFYTLRAMLDGGYVTPNNIGGMVIVAAVIHVVMIIFALMRCRTKKGETV